MSTPNRSCYLPKLTVHSAKPLTDATYLMTLSTNGLNSSSSSCCEAAGSGSSVSRSSDSISAAVSGVLAAAAGFLAVSALEVGLVVAGVVSAVAEPGSLPVTAVVSWSSFQGFLGYSVDKGRAPRHLSFFCSANLHTKQQCNSPRSQVIY